MTQIRNPPNRFPYNSEFHMMSDGGFLVSADIYDTNKESTKD